ncbi:LexA family protein [Geomicrobium sediminis]|uniref:Repressor LexA n=1 Tax=Geomicrobium sediminis TaxID=1347788 RepID=A0ABS2PEG8_9BACL|nr:hypothetical protein [Geomicrobium sediminis]MBM7633803.1 repressor LexA [Geomicrobium sediminis]
MTKKQEEALKVAITYIENNGYAPTFRELAELLGVKAVSAVHTLFSRLKAKGIVTWEYDKPRTLKILKREVT